MLPRHAPLPSGEMKNDVDRPGNRAQVLRGAVTPAVHAQDALHNDNANPSSAAARRNAGISSGNSGGAAWHAISADAKRNVEAGWKSHSFWNNAKSTGAVMSSRRGAGLLSLSLFELSGTQNNCN